MNTQPLAKLACSSPVAVWVRVQLQSLKLWILLFSFSWFTKQHGTQNLFVYVECSSVKYGASLFFVRKNFERKGKKEWNTKKKWHLDGLISQVQVLSAFLFRSSMYYIMLTLHNPIKPLNIVSTISFSWGPNFTSTTALCANDLRQLQLAPITTWDDWHLPE